MNVKVYVEGGRGRRELSARCREGFRTFFCKAGLAERMPKIVAGGARSQTYEKFRIEVDSAGENDFVVLLVDSEKPVADGDSSWTHLKRYDNWDGPADELDKNAHLMVQCMEAWFLADRDALASYFGNCFNQCSLPRREDIENVPKSDVEQGLKKATWQCKKKRYDKGSHSFGILAKLSPEKVAAASPYARRLIDTLLTKAS